jgi:hypothetical protein
MIKQDIVKNYHDLLVSELEQNIVSGPSPEWLQECREVIILGSGLQYKVEKLQNRLLEINPKLSIHSVVKQEIANDWLMKNDQRYQPIIWDERFSLDVVAEIRQRLVPENIDALFFISRDRIDLRDNNLLEIANELIKERSIKVANYNSNNWSMTEYSDVKRVLVILKAYENLMSMVHEVFCLDNKKKMAGIDG